MVLSMRPTRPHTLRRRASPHDEAATASSSTSHHSYHHAQQQHAHAHTSLPRRRRAMAMARLVVAVAALLLLLLLLAAVCVTWYTHAMSGTRTKTLRMMAIATPETASSPTALSPAMLQMMSTALCDGATPLPLSRRATLVSYMYTHTRDIVSRHLYTIENDSSNNTTYKNNTYKNNTYNNSNNKNNRANSTHKSSGTTMLQDMQRTAAWVLDAAAFAHPPLQRAALARCELQALLRYGPRVPGTVRDGVLQHLLREGLAARHDWRQRANTSDTVRDKEHAGDAAAACLREDDAETTAPPLPVPLHLSPLGACLLRRQDEQQQRRRARSNSRRSSSSDDAGDEDDAHVAFARADKRGWRWDVRLDAFTEQVPVRRRSRGDKDDAAAGDNNSNNNSSTRDVNFTNIVFAFAGGAHTRAARRRRRRDGGDVYSGAAHARPPLDVNANATTTTLPSPRHVMFAAHWDTLQLHTTTRAATQQEQQQQQQQPRGEAKDTSGAVPFVGASDSAVPVLMLLRLMKSIAMLSDVADAVTALYAAEEAAAAAVAAAAAANASNATMIDDSNATAARTSGDRARMSAMAKDAATTTPTPADSSSAATGATNSSTTATPAASDASATTTTRAAAPVRDGAATTARAVRFVDRDVGDVWAHVRRVLAPAPAALLREYFFAPMPPRNDTGNDSNDARKRSKDGGEDENNLDDDVRVWLDAVQRLPAITVALFDGEEAMVSWRGNDNTRGSRHLAARWRRECVAWRRGGGNDDNNNNSGDGSAAARACAATRYDTVDLFVLLDLLGPSTTRLRNFWPTQSGVYYAALQRRERALHARTRAHAAALCAAPAADTEAAATATKTPMLWRALGSPHELFAVTHHTDAGEDEEGAYFAASEAARTRHSAAQPTPDDDHKHWLDTQRVLMLTASPFPRAWHTTGDDASNIDDGVVVDLDALLLRFALALAPRDGGGASDGARGGAV